VVYADKNGLKRRNLMIQKSRKLLERFVNSRIIYNILNEQAWTEYLNQDDPAIIETLRLFHEGKAFPQPVSTTAEGQTIARIYDSSIVRLSGSRHLAVAIFNS
jgi:carboxyl-terminal processing protease